MMTCLNEITKSIHLNRGGLYIACNILLLTLCLCPVKTSASGNQDIPAAIELLEQKEYSAALDLLIEIKTTLPDPGRLSRLLSVAYLGLGYQRLASGDFPAARESFLDGRHYAEDDVRFWQGEAMTWLKQGQYAEAASVLEQVLGFAPQNADIYYLLGKAYYADGRMAQALDALTRSVDFGGGGEVVVLREKVKREWQIEQEMGYEARGHFQLSFVDGHTASLATEVLETLEEAYSELGAELAYYPDVRVPVLLYSRNDFSAVTKSPDWAGAVYDGKIRIPMGGLTHMTDQLKSLLYHEYMHVVVHFLANRNVPTWLNEGLAEVAGRRHYAPPQLHLQAAAEENKLIPWQELSKSFSGLEAGKVLLAYEQSSSIVHFMVDRFGWHKMSDLLALLGKGQAWQAAIAVVYNDYGINWPAILEEWQASLDS